MEINNIRNIALFAHVDAGKTSLTEQFLFASKKIKTLGSVDKGNSQTDTLEVEKERGITVNSTILTFDWENIKINLIDTPGHIDFSSETEKSIEVIDAAIVLVSAVEGIQAQTVNMIDLLKIHKKPFVVFVNKIDRIGADLFDIYQELERELDLKIFPIHEVENIATDTVQIQNIWSKENYQTQSNLIESLVEFDDTLFEQYLDALPISWPNLNTILKTQITKQNIVPILLGSAKKEIGISNLLNSIVDLLPAPQKTSDDLLACVFKTYHKKGEGKISAIRIFDGLINSRSEVFNASKESTEKISIIKNTDIQEQAVIQSFSAGEIAWVQGLKLAEPGDYLGQLPKHQIKYEKSRALLTVQVEPVNIAEINALIEALQVLNNEDPDLQFEYLKEEQELHINIRGKVQEEILQSILKTRFNLEVKFQEPTVIYKETPTVDCEGYVRYWMPKPCWAIMKFKIEPAERGTGVQYSSVIGVNDVKQQYQNDVAKMIPTALKQGVLGWQVDDIKITLIEGEDHEMHTKSNDFAIATPMGIMEGLTHSESTLLEPILSFRISAPEENLGVIISELIKLRAEFESPIIENAQCKIKGEIPLASSINFPIKLSSMTSGKGKIISKFSTYKACDTSLGKTRDFKGISPLDTAKYILKARKALV